MMKRLFKILISKIKHWDSFISLDSDVSLDTRLGNRTRLVKARVYRSQVGNDCVLNHIDLFSSKFGDSVQCGKGSYLHASKLSDNIVIGPHTDLTESSIGRFTYLAGNNRIFNCEIGSFCSIAENVMIGHAEHPLNFLSTSPLFYKSGNPFNNLEFREKDYNEFSKTIIGNDVWIGANVYIKAGITVHDGAVIGAGAVVTKDVDPFTIVGGIPAKFLKARFSASQIKKLQELKWWNFDNQQLKRAKSYFGKQLDDETIDLLFDLFKTE